MTTPTPATPEQIRQRHAQAQRDNAARAAVVVGSVLAASRAGSIPQGDVRGVLKRVMRESVTYARRLADLATAAELSVTVGRPLPPVGLDEDEATSGAVELGVDTILDDEADQLAALLDEPDDLDDDLAALLEDDEPEPDDERPSNVIDLAEMRAKRLAKNASLEAGQRATQEALKAQGVEGWVRETDDDPCQLCQALADGKVIPISKAVLTHPGCSCTLQPTTADGEPLDAENFEPIRLADLEPPVQPARTLYTGHGLGRVAHEQLPSGFKITRPAPKTRPASEWRRPGDPRRRNQ